MELCRLLDRQVRGLGSLEDFPVVDADLTPKRGDVGSITDQTASIDESLQLIDRWNDVTRSQRGDLFASKKKESVGANDNCVGVLFGDRGEGGFQRTPVVSLQDQQLYPLWAYRLLR